jgi:uncharacterized protein (TIGR02996 family)
MQDESAIFDFLRLHPDDRVAYLAYADWLDEHQRHDEAEFIRVEVELDTPRLPHPRYHELKHRRAELFEGLYPEKVPEGFEVGTRWGLMDELRWTFHSESAASIDNLVQVIRPFRFVRSLTLQLYHPHNLQSTTSEEPFQAIEKLLADFDGDTNNLLTERFRSIQTLELCHPLPSSLLQRIPSTPLFQSLTSLKLFMIDAGQLPEVVALFGLIARSPCQHSLTELRLEFMTVNENLIQEFCQWPCIARLRTLQLVCRNIDSGLVRMLLRLNWPELEKLALSQISSPIVSADLTSTFPKLRSINLGYWDVLHLASCEAILKQPWAKQLEVWRQPGPITEEMIDSLSSTLHSGSLKEFYGYTEFESNRPSINLANLKRLLASPCCQKLEVLSFFEPSLGDAAVDIIRSSDCFPHLRILDVGESGFSVPALHKLFSDPQGKSLEFMRLVSIKGAENEGQLVDFIEKHIHMIAPGHWRVLVVEGAVWQPGDATFLAIAENLHRLHPDFDTLDFRGMVSDEAFSRLSSLSSFIQSQVRIEFKANQISLSAFENFLSVPELANWRGRLRLHSLRDAEAAGAMVQKCRVLHSRAKIDFFEYVTSEFEGE